MKQKPRRMLSILCAASVICSLGACDKDSSSSNSSENIDVSGYESKIAELEGKVESLKAETVPDIEFRDKSDYMLGKDNPAVSEAAAAKKEVMADLPQFITIKGEEYSTDLTTLTLNSKGLVDDDIKDLKYMVNLTELHIYQNNITDITPLKGLTNLKVLSLFSNKISDLSPLAGLVSLDNLYLRANNISDISPLDGLLGLTVLDVSENNISDITPLADMRNLTLLRLNDNNITDISALSSMKHIDRLHLQNNNISDITPVMNMEEITEIYLENNLISNVEPLMSLTTLGWVKLGKNPVTNLNPLTNLINLKKLYIEDISIAPEELQSLVDKLPGVTIITK